MKILVSLLIKEYPDTKGYVGSFAIRKTPQGAIYGSYSFEIFVDNDKRNRMRLYSNNDAEALIDICSDTEMFVRVSDEDNREIALQLASFVYADIRHRTQLKESMATHRINTIVYTMSDDQARSNFQKLINQNVDHQMLI